MKYILILLAAALVFSGIFLLSHNDVSESEGADFQEEERVKGVSTENTRSSTREILITEGVKHSVLLEEMISEGQGKDSIPSIDKPNFISAEEADQFLDEDSQGLGLRYKGETRFYPYQILVWHELVNDMISGDALLISYAPLSGSGIVFDRSVRGEVYEFGVSGKLWQSNLLMYRRNADEESLWSQILSETVLGPETGTTLLIISSDTVRYGDWKKKYPGTKVLSLDTGATRRYGADPYEDYYTNESVSFDTEFSDERLHPKEVVSGIELSGLFKAYPKDALPRGQTNDSFLESTIRIEKSDIGEVKIFADEKEAEVISSFWFSWLSAHPETELYQDNLK
ncbi:MAG: DUF3179 domain-containing protein [Candidatus Harrisonbacteria bacterium]|nr:DUF3179 domain-containing protein [Candidatus Harrisonbacteria bacterium]